MQIIALRDGRVRAKKPHVQPNHTYLCWITLASSNRWKMDLSKIIGWRSCVVWSSLTRFLSIYVLNYEGILEIEDLWEESEYTQVPLQHVRVRNLNSAENISAEHLNKCHKERRGKCILTRWISLTRIIFNICTIRSSFIHMKSYSHITQLTDAK